jgi:hypothetical protein
VTFTGPTAAAFVIRKMSALTTSSIEIQLIH